MTSEEGEDWVPRYRLRHLHGLQARYLKHSTPHPANTYFAVWSHTHTANKQHEAHCLYVSEQVPLTIAPEWLPIDLSKCTLASEALHGLLSGIIHVHVYVLSSEPRNADVPALHGPAHPSTSTLEARAHPTLSPLHDCNGGGNKSEESPDAGAAAEADSHDIESLSGTRRKAAQEDMKEEAQSQLKQGSAALSELPSSPSEPDAAHFVGFQQLLQAPVPPPEFLQYQLCRRTAPQAAWPQSTDQVTDLRLCSEPRLPGELVLAVSVDLGCLTCLGQDLRLLDDVAPGIKLVFEMADGTYLVWPGMPDDWAPPTAADTQKSAALPSATSADQIEEKAGRWGGLFRRAALGSMPDLLEQDPTDLTASSAADPVRVPSLQSLATGGSGNELSQGLQGTLSAESLSSLPQPPAKQALFAALESSMRKLIEMQQRGQAVRALAAKALHKLNAAVQAREQARLQRVSLAEARDAVSDCRQQARYLEQRARAVRSSAAAARDLMQSQGMHLASALSRLEALWEDLEGPAAADWQAMLHAWPALHRKLVARRCRLPADLQHIFGIRPRAVSVVEAPQSGFLWHQLERAWSEVPVTAAPKPLHPALPAAATPLRQASSPEESQSRSGSVAGDSDSGVDNTISELSNTGSQIREIARLAIGALDLEPTIGRQRSEHLAALGRESEKDEEIRLAVALGYAAHVTHHLAGYLDVPLKYPIRPANSRSAVKDHQLPVCLLSQGALEGQGAADAPAPTQYQLYPDGTERTRFSYAVFLLNKDIEQLLSVHGLTSVGPNHVLQNLFKLMSAASSAVPPRPEWQ